ncbi:S8 family peptidase [Virgibacillus xinjiangensis]|uniref:S8 family peptidase n=1 Tax=Virgibacillus xinjiangensis TaxID=393090 RepID=A0ABV7CYD7_9BACI
MNRRLGPWFEHTGRKLDPGLIEQLRNNRKTDPLETSNHEIPVIVHFKKEYEQAAKNNILQTCNKVSHNKLDKEFRLINGMQGYLTPAMIKQIKDDDSVERIFYDRRVSAFLDIASHHTGASQVKEQLQLTGKDVTIAVIDTGIYPHEDLTNPVNRIIAFKDLVAGKEDPYDDNGHGTHCAGDAAGNGYLSEGEYISPAPEASIIGIKALDSDGGGRLSTIMEGIEWCIEHKKEYNIRIISLSLGAPAYESFRDDPLSLTVQEAWHQGIVVCAAAGNSGPQSSTISTPAINPFVLTVGSADDNDTLKREDDSIAEYSSRGPTIDSFIKPDVYSPGSNIISLLAPDSAVEKQLPEQIINKGYIQMSGTSMATPICAGIIALMLEVNPHLSPNDIKSILQSTARPMLNDTWGYIDAVGAVNMAENYQSWRKEVTRS